jgi:uncharacterized RDD family membrane protein YckC
MSSPTPEPPPIGIRLSALSGYLSEPGSLQGVGFWPRALARFIDFTVHYGIAYSSGVLFGTMMVLAAGGHVPPMMIARLRHSSIVAFVLVLSGSIAFEAICEAVHGSTPGKLALSMVVVQEDATPCRVNSAIVRSFAYLIDSLFFGLIAYSAMKQTAQEQRLGDGWAETVVSKRADIPRESLRSTGRFIVALLFAAITDSALCMLALLVKLNS